GILEFTRRPDQKCRMQGPLASVQGEAPAGGFGDALNLAIADNRQIVLPGEERQVVSIPLPVGMFHSRINGGRTQLVDRIQVSQAERVAVKRRRDEAGLRWPTTE